MSTMGVDIAVYRCKIGLFCMPVKVRTALRTLSLSKKTVSKILRLAIFLSVLVTLGGDVETNPGPSGRGTSNASEEPRTTRATRQTTLPYAEAVCSPSTSHNVSEAQRPRSRATVSVSSLSQVETSPRSTDNVSSARRPGRGEKRSTELKTNEGKAEVSACSQPERSELFGFIAKN